MIRTDSSFCQYKFDPEEGNAWIMVKGFNIHIHQTDEGVVVDIWGNTNDNAPIASTYAFDFETEKYHDVPVRGDEIGELKLKDDLSYCSQCGWHFATHKDDKPCVKEID